MGAHPTLILFFPFLIDTRAGPFSFGARVARLLSGVAACLMGWLVMYVGVVLLWPRASSPWGDVSTLSGWWTFVSGELYRGYVFGLPLAQTPARLAALLAVMMQQFTPLGMLGCMIGIAHMWRIRRDLAAASLISFALVMYFTLGYNTTDSFVYLVPALALGALWLAFGLSKVVARLPVGLAALILLLPFAQLVFSYHALDLSGDRAAIEWAGRILRASPPQAIVLTERDEHTFTLWYAQTGLGLRPDVTVLDRDLWAYPPYRRLVEQEHGLADVAAAEQAAQQTGRPIVWASAEDNSP
jgi:hypothetical protein